MSTMCTVHMYVYAGCVYRVVYQYVCVYIEFLESFDSSMSSEEAKRKDLEGTVVQQLASISQVSTCVSIQNEYPK